MFFHEKRVLHLLKEKKASDKKHKSYMQGQDASKIFF